jgi:hypothetical protein
MPISAIVMIFVVIWVYQTTVREKTENKLYWVAGAGAVFLAMVALFTVLDFSEMLDAGAKRNTGETVEGFKEVLFSLYFEVFPGVAGFFVIAALRVKFILKAAFTPANLFSGIGEMFVSIKDSFKSTATTEE